MTLTEDELQAASLAVVTYPRRFKAEDEQGEQVLDALTERGYIEPAGDGWYRATDRLIDALRQAAENN